MLYFLYLITITCLTRNHCYNLKTYIVNISCKVTQEHHNHSDL